jgi:monoamine oxidase
VTRLSHALWQITLLNFSERIHLKKAVVQIRHMDDGVIVKTLDGTVFNGSYVILAIPPPAHVNTDLSFTGATDLFI